MKLVADDGEERFPGFDTFAESPAWDEVTQGVVRDRLETEPNDLTFFTAGEAVIARALLDRLLALDDEAPVPVVALIDARLTIGEGDGYRYGSMPDDGEAWRRSLAGLEYDALDRFGAPFAELNVAAGHALIQAIQDTSRLWHDLPAGRVFDLWMRYACTAFYSHPQAWNEIGFGGPAYPRGYKNIGIDRREPWEKRAVDAHDPVPWAQRVAAARLRHEQPHPADG